MFDLDTVEGFTLKQLRSKATEIANIEDPAAYQLIDAIYYHKNRLQHPHLVRVTKRALALRTPEFLAKCLNRLEINQPYLYGSRTPAMAGVAS